MVATTLPNKQTYFHYIYLTEEQARDYGSILLRKALYDRDNYIVNLRMNVVKKLLEKGVSRCLNEIIEDIEYHEQTRTLIFLNTSDDYLEYIISDLINN